MRLAKAGFGAVKTAYDYVPLVADAKAAGLITTCHTGGSSIPGSGAITGDHLLKMHPHVSFHINGGPTAMPDADFERVILETEIALQVCTAGNLRTTLLCARLAQQHGAFDRFIIATDTPTGSGIMPLGMLYTIAHLVEPDRHAAGALHLRRHRQQCESLWPRQRLSRAGQGRRHRADRRAGRRHAVDRARRDQARRYRGHRRGHHRRHAALRRPQPQHAGDHGKARVVRSRASRRTSPACGGIRMHA